MQGFTPAFAYFLIVFGAGFLLGTIRVLLLLPVLGERAAELLEMPFMLIVIVLAARWIDRRFLAGVDDRGRIVVGLLAFGLVALVIAGVLSYAASSSPDGLDSATQRGCETVEVNGAEQLRGNCIAQHAGDHAMASSPLADYSVSGLGDNSGGVAGVIGVVVTVLVAGGLFWLLARGRRSGAGN